MAITRTKQLRLTRDELTALKTFFLMRFAENADDRNVADFLLESYKRELFTVYLKVLKAEERDDFYWSKADSGPRCFGIV